MPVSVINVERGMKGTVNLMLSITTIEAKLTWLGLYAYFQWV